MLFLTMFDPSSVEECYRRHETIVPQQALALTNSKMTFDRADEMARILSAAAGGGDLSTADFVNAAFEHILGRTPTEAEQVAAIDGLERLAAVEKSDVAAPNAAPAAGAAGSAQKNDTENGTGKGTAASQAGSTPVDRARAAFIHVLLNHNDFVTIR